MDIEMTVSTSSELLSNIIDFVISNGLQVVVSRSELSDRQELFVFRDMRNTLDIALIADGGDDSHYPGILVIVCDHYDLTLDWYAQDKTPKIKKDNYMIFVKLFSDNSVLSCLYSDGNIMLSVTDSDTHKTTNSVSIGYLGTADSNSSLFLLGNLVKTSATNMAIDDGIAHLGTLVHKVVDNGTSGGEKTYGWLLGAVQHKNRYDYPQWKSGDKFSAGSFFVYNETIYEVLVPHVSSDFAVDLQHNRVQARVDQYKISQWTPNMKFRKGDFFMCGGTLYKVLNMHNASDIMSDLNAQKIAVYEDYETIRGNCLTSINRVPNIPTYTTMIGTTPQRIGLSVSTLNCASLVMPIQFFVLRDPEVLGLYSSIGYSSVFNYVNMYNISSGSIYTDESGSQYKCMSLYRRRYNDLFGRWYIGIAFELSGGR